MVEKIERLNTAYKLLQDKGLVHSKVQFANLIGKTEAQVSLAFRNVPKRLTTGFLISIADAFPDIINREYMTEGTGDIELPNKKLIPHYPAKVRAGFLSGVADSVTEEDVEYREPMSGFRMYDFTIEVEGDSMVPTFFPGDIIACRKLENGNNLKPRTRYVFDTRQGAVVKTYLSSNNNKLRLASDNPGYGDLRIDEEDIFGIAEVVGSVNVNIEERSAFESEAMKEYMLKVATRNYDRLLREIIDTTPEDKIFTKDDMIEIVKRMMDNKE